MHEQENGNESSHNSSTNGTSSFLLKPRCIPEFAGLSVSTYNLPFCIWLLGVSVNVLTDPINPRCFVLWMTIQIRVFPHLHNPISHSSLPHPVLPLQLSSKPQHLKTKPSAKTLSDPLRQHSLLILRNHSISFVSVLLLPG
jgi:hypothetical protein